MATYIEIHDLRSNAELRHRVAVAILKKAQALLDATSPAPTAAQIAWARNAIRDPQTHGDSFLGYVLAKNSGSTVAQITSASDATLQSQVGAAVDVLIAGGA